MAPRGQYRDWELFRSEVQRLWDELGEFPSERKVSELDREDLRHAFRLHGGWRAVRQRMGAPKTSGKFADFETELKPELEEFIRAYGRLSDNFLREKGRNDLVLAISKQGGMIHVKELLGLPVGKVAQKSPMRQWSYFKDQVEAWIESHGDFPEHRDLVAERRSDMILGFRFHGGANRVREIMGYPLSGFAYGETTCQYKDFDDLKKALEPLIAEAGGKYPSCKMIQQKFANLRYAIDTYHGGHQAVRLRLGLESTGKQPHPFDDKETYLEALKAVTERLGAPPTLRDLEALKRHDLLYVVEMKKHGSWRDVRVELGWPVRPTLGNLRDEAVFQQRFAEAVEMIGHYPTSLELREHGYSALEAAIKRYHGGINVFRELCGEKLALATRTLPKDELLNRLRQIRKELGRRPTKQEVFEMGGQYVAMAIRQKKYGSWETVCDLLRWEPTYCTSPYRDVRVTKRTIRKLIARIGHFPRSRELRRMGFATLANAISNLHGGFYRFAEEMGEPYGKSRNLSNPYRSFLKLSTELRTVFAGDRIELPLIYRLERWDLLSGVIMNGGIGRVRRIMALQDKEALNPVTGKPSLSELLAAMEKDSDAVEMVLKKSERLIESIVSKAFDQSVRRHEAVGVERDDLIHEGKLGVLNALRDYDPVLGEFSTHATPWIRRNVSRFILEKGYQVRIPHNEYEDWSKLCKVRNELAEQKNRPPYFEELLRATGWSHSRLNNVLSLEPLLIGTRSLSETVSSDEDTEINDFVTDGRSTETIAEGNLVVDMVREEIARLLTPAEQRVIISRLGLLGTVETQQEIAGVLGISQMQVSRIEERAKGKLAQSEVLRKLIDDE